MWSFTDYLVSPLLLLKNWCYSLSPSYTLQGSYGWWKTWKTWKTGHFCKKSWKKLKKLTKAWKWSWKKKKKKKKSVSAAFNLFSINEFFIVIIISLSCFKHLFFYLVTVIISYIGNKRLCSENLNFKVMRCFRISIIVLVIVCMWS